MLDPLPLRSSGMDLGSAVLRPLPGEKGCLGSAGVDFISWLRNLDSSGPGWGSRGMYLGCWELEGLGSDEGICLDCRGMHFVSPMPSSSKGKETSSELDASGDPGVPPLCAASAKRMAAVRRLLRAEVDGMGDTEATLLAAPSMGCGPEFRRKGWPSSDRLLAPNRGARSALDTRVASARSPLGPPPPLGNLSWRS